MFESQLDVRPTFPPPQQARRGLRQVASDRPPDDMAPDSATDSMPDIAPDPALLDWAVLMDAVKARLHLLVDQHLAAPAKPVDPDTALWVRSGVLDCVDALDHLQATLLQQQLRQRQANPALADGGGLDGAMSTRQAGDASTGSGADGPSALHDSLTSLPNRRYFQAQLAHTLGAAGPHPAPVALLSLDLDGFKAINDLHGPNVGDALLQIVAARLKRAVRVHDMVSRLGDDAFACLLHGSISPQHLGRLAGKLGDAVAAPVQIGALTLTVRASVGLARCPDDAQSAEALLQRADAARRQAKSRAKRHAAAEAGGDWPLLSELDSAVTSAADAASYKVDGAAGVNGAESRAAG